MDQIALAIFAKTLGTTPVKTRLAASEGREFAEQFYRAAVEAIREVMREEQRLGFIVPHWALAEEHVQGTAAVNAAERGPSEWSGFPVLWQGAGDLGDRLATVFSTLLENYPGVIIIGTDLPQISGDQIRTAAEWIATSATPRAVVGPSVDGGFYLFGANRPIAREKFTSVVYSSHATRDQFLKVVTAGFQVHELPLLSDLDIADDMQRVHEELSRAALLLPGQQAVLDLLSSAITVKLEGRFLKKP